MDSINLWEWVGYLASVVVAISLMMSDIKKLRWWNLIGAALFVAYGLAIDALPVALVNFFIVLIDIYYLVKLYREPTSTKEH
ncbi:YgjV family protein [Shewanella inventionis]|uniref:Membrane protein n=1 Tax=Shewanella inventionis TaxID=1738770 RepID=A0ABQ1IWA7_9GAMM|nr:YgjV family protein [Shewanella inventionis]MCL1156962.1 YgjV family protein [Shewanella inventionis]UAL43126.1 YgjV family protein [Shewanella inventionis]GGB54140.1 membrane protein [Shewanella inventionis]